MKKTIFALLSVLVAAAFSPSASAVPAFARQTGMACSACHFQSYPILTSFGKTFKISGFTLMGAQGKIEGEQGLSMPNTLNTAVLLKARYKKTNGKEMDPYGVTPGTNVPPAQPTPDTPGNDNPRTTNSGRIDMPDEFALFAAGRVSENIGALVEINIAGAGGAGVANFKVPFVFDLGNIKMGVVPFSGDAGVAYGFDLFATGSNTTGRVIENAEGYSVAKYLGTITEVTGAAIYLANEDFHVAATPWFQGSQLTAAGGTATALGGQYLRAAWTPSVAGWDLGLGVQRFSGNSQKGIDGIAPGTTRDSATIFDAQAQGAVGDMPLGIYASVGIAPASTTSVANTFNGSTVGKRGAGGILADLGVIPQVLGVQLGLIRGKTGAVYNSKNETDNGWTFGLRYKMRQNMNFGMAYTKFSGTAYSGPGDGTGASKDASVAGNTGNSLLNITMVTGF